MPSDDDSRQDSLRDRLIGLGERSMAKSYYPELRRKLEELERFRAVIDHANDSIFVFKTEDWSVVDVNETALLMLGMERSQVLGLRITDLFPAEIAARYAGALENAHTPSGGLQFRNGHIVTTLSGAQGRSVPTEITVTLHSFAGKGYAVVIARDVTVRMAMEAELDKSRRLFASFMENLPASASIKDSDGRYIYCNPAFGVYLGSPAREVTGRMDSELWPGDVVDQMHESDAFVRREGRSLTVQQRVRPIGGDGAQRTLQVTKFPILQQGRIIGVAAVGLDISRQVRTEQALKESEDRHRIVAEYTHGMECWVGPQGGMLYVSPSCERITGYPREHFMQDPHGLEDLVVEGDREAWLGFHSRPDDESLDYRIRTRDGRVRWVNEVKREVTAVGDQSMGSRLSLRDITERKHMELQLRHLALHDPLTGLANRSLCLDRIQQAMERSRRVKRSFFSVIFLDLDRFKVLNDSLGHVFGDKVLLLTAEVLRASVRAFDTVARFGGDEFVLILEELSSPREAIQAVQRLRKAISRPLVVDGHEIQLTASLGLTLSAQDSTTPDDLLRNANVAMHQAKKSGRNRFKTFTRAMLDRASTLLAMETDLRRAVGRNEFFLEYQPIVRLADQPVLHGFEALVRWNHPRKGVVPPSLFIPVAEDSGLIVDIGLIVLREACRTLKNWRDQTPGAETLVMSVNLSPRQFSESTLVEDVKAVLQETGLPPGALKLEITETAIMDNAAGAVDKLRKLKAQGMALSIDDFGTGYSSMSSLQQFPLDTLKIDLSFVRRIEDGPEGQEIVKAIISLAHSLQLQVIAEGVERPSQRDILRGLKCEFAQGYLYSRPMSETNAREYLEACAAGESCLRDAPTAD